MKAPLFALTLAVACAVVSPGSLAAQSTPSLLSEAQRDYVEGRLDEAKMKFHQILAEDPRNVAARNYIKMIDDAERRSGPGRRLEAQLREMMVPSVELNEATLDATLDYLRQQAERLSEGRVKVNFVVATGVNREATVTLRLSNIPFTEVLRYVGSLAKVRFAMDQYAISVHPVAGAEPAVVPVGTTGG